MRKNVRDLINNYVVKNVSMSDELVKAFSIVENESNEMVNKFSSIDKCFDLMAADMDALSKKDNAYSLDINHSDSELNEMATADLNYWISALVA